MLEKLNARIVLENLHTTFQLHRPGAPPVALELVEVAENEQSPKVEQFSLVFRGPAERYFPQGIYTVEHDKLGKFDLFFVPIGQEPAGIRYEVAFNRLRSSAQTAD